VYLLTIETGMYLKNSTRPVPNLNIVGLCGCEETNTFFCFVYLLLGGDDKWTEEGV
jgi:hypothetical protein